MEYQGQQQQQRGILAPSCNSGQSKSTIICNEYRAAIALNNVAVQLGERGCDRKALETFRAAFSIIKAVAASASAGAGAGEEEEEEGRRRHRKRQKLLEKEESSPSPMSSQDDVDLKVRTAIKAVSSSTGNAASASGYSGGCAALSVVPDDCADLSRADVSAPPELTLIRIEEYGNEANSCRDVELDCGVILHNVGVAYMALSLELDRGARCCSPTAEPQPAAAAATTTTMRNRAVQLLRMSQSLLLGRTAALEAPASDDQCREALRKGFFLSIVATGSLGNALEALAEAQGGSCRRVEDEDPRILECREQVRKLRSAAHNLGLFLPSIGGQGGEEGCRHSSPSACGGPSSSPSPSTIAAAAA